MPDGTQIDYDGLIPNNVGLADDLRVRKALETWYPGFIEWWKAMGPEGFQDSPVFLRTAVGVGNTRNYTVMTYTGSRSGTFNSTDFTTAGFDATEWTANYGTAGEVRLVFTPVPEPATILAFVALGGGALGIYRRWRKKGDPATAA